MKTKSIQPARRIKSTTSTYRFSVEAVYEAQKEKAIRTQDWDFLADDEQCYE